MKPEPLHRVCARLKPPLYPLAADAPPRQALYIAGSDRCTITARHGALELTATGRALRRFPLGRIDRIVCRRTVDWSGEALCLCLEHGITVLFENGHGHAIGYALPAIEPGEPLHHCLQRFAGFTEASTSFDNWLRHRRMEIVAQWWEAYTVSHPATTGYYYDEVKRQFVYWKEIQPRLAEALRPLCEASVLAELRRAGALPAYDTLDDAKLALLEELTILLWGQINLQAGALAVLVADRLLQITFLESWLQQNSLVITRHLTALKLFATDMLRPWQ